MLVLGQAQGSSIIKEKIRPKKSEKTNLSSGGEGQ